MYVEFIDHCTQTAFLDCHKHALGHFGGIPGEILYDNMKNVVARRLTGRAVFNDMLPDFSAYSGFKPQAAPPYAPEIMLWMRVLSAYPLGSLSSGLCHDAVHELYPLNNFQDEVRFV